MGGLERAVKQQASTDAVTRMSDVCGMYSRELWRKEELVQALVAQVWQRRWGDGLVGSWPWVVVVGSRLVDRTDISAAYYGLRYAKYHTPSPTRPLTLALDLDLDLGHRRTNLIRGASRGRYCSSVRT